MYEFGVGQKPVIASQLSAKRQAEQWQKLKSLHPRDAHGLLWELVVLPKEKPHPEQAKKLVWSLSLQLKASATIAQLLATKTLAVDADARLLTLLQEPLIFTLPPLYVQADTEVEVVRAANRELPAYLERLQASDLHLLKRQMITLQLEQQSCFGALP